MSEAQRVEASKLLAQAAKIFEAREARIKTIRDAIDALCMGAESHWSCKVTIDDHNSGVEVSLSVSKGVLRPLLQAELAILDAAQSRLKEKMDSAAEILVEDVRAA